MTADDLIVEGDRLAVRSTMRGTHEGDFMGIPATGKTVEVSNFDFVRFANDRAAEHWGAIDSDAMMEQLGVAPPGS
jgi:predicted ester cyclase